MSGTVNKVILIGHLGKDPEIATMQDGKKMAKFSLATNERKDIPEWHNVVVFNDKLAELLSMYVKKGSKVYVEGQMQTRKWTDKSNIERYVTEVVLSQYKGELKFLDGSSDREEQGRSYEPKLPKLNHENIAMDVDDDLPF